MQHYLHEFWGLYFGLSFCYIECHSDGSLWNIWYVEALSYIIFMGLWFFFNCICAEQMMMTYLYTDIFDVSKSSFLKLMPSLWCAHPLLAILDIYLMILFLLKLVRHAIYPQFCLQFVMNINCLNLFRHQHLGSFWDEDSQEGDWSRQHTRCGQADHLHHHRAWCGGWGDNQWPVMW